MRMPLVRCCAALLAWAASSAALACTPPAQLEAAGFSRHDVGHLPKNARGVIFLPENGVPGPGDFRVDSRQDKRPLTLRVHPLPSRATVRLELSGGFQPGAEYAFRYLPAHGQWRHPDAMRVTIDDVTVTTGGRYAIELAPRPAHRVVLVPSSSGSCVEPAPALVQAFHYAVPPALARYRDALDYDTAIDAASTSAVVDAWPAAPALYETPAFSLGLGFSARYTLRDNAVIAACGKRWGRVRLRGVVGFPEVDDVLHRAAAVEFDMRSKAKGQCGELEALLQTIGGQAPEPVLREVCGVYIGAASASGEPALRTVGLDQWELNLSLFFHMSPTCNLVALAHLWHTRQLDMSPRTLDRIGTALNSGIHHAKPAERDAAVHALAYLVRQLPVETRRGTARQLLAPAQSALVDAVAAPKTTRLDELAGLIISSGTLAPPARQALRETAKGRNAAAAQARAILAAMPD